MVASTASVTGVGMAFCYVSGDAGMFCWSELSGGLVLRVSCVRLEVAEKRAANEKPRNKKANANNKCWCGCCSFLFHKRHHTPALVPVRGVTVTQQIADDPRVLLLLRRDGARLRDDSLQHSNTPTTDTINCGR